MKHSGVISFLTWCVVLLASSSKTVRADTAAGVAAMKGMDWRYFVAGGVCAATSHGITTPIDVVKTRMQAEPEVCINVFVCLFLVSYVWWNAIKKKRKAMKNITQKGISLSDL